MEIERMPFCCTSAILGSFGEHGEDSLVTVEEIERQVQEWRRPVYRKDKHGDLQLVENGKRCIFAISVDPVNILILKAAGFTEVDQYEGVQGTVHIFTLHVK